METVIPILFVLIFAAYLFFLIYNLFKKRVEKKKENIIINKRNLQNDMILKSLCKLLYLDVSSLTKKQIEEIKSLFFYTYTRLKSKNVIIRDLTKILTIKYKDIIIDSEQAESVIAFCSEIIKNNDFYIRNDRDGELIFMQNNNGLGMKWFNFFYKFSIPLGMILTLLSCISSFILAFSDDMIYIADAVLQLIHFILSFSIFINFRKSKSEGIRSYPFRLYYLTIIFIVYFALIEIWLNVYSSFVCIPYMILNIIYFNKRKSMFKD